MNLSLIISYYEAPEMLKEQIKHWEEYPPNVRIIVVDDHSIKHSAEPILIEYAGNVSCQVQLYRINQDIYQNTFGARNLGFHVVGEGEWVWNLDVDHVVPFESIQAFLDMQMSCKGCYYLPAREEVLSNVPKTVTKEIQRHSDTFILTRETFWKTGGYDEDLIGYYFNGAATKFRQTLKSIAKGVTVNHGVKTLFYPAGIIGDASPINSMEKKRYLGIQHPNKKPSVLQFQWDRLL